MKRRHWIDVAGHRPTNDTTLLRSTVVSDSTAFYCFAVYETAYSRNDDNGDINNDNTTCADGKRPRDEVQVR